MHSYLKEEEEEEEEEEEVVEEVVGEDVIVHAPSSRMALEAGKMQQRQ